MPSLLNAFVQKQRPMDNMRHDLFEPQEEEFAILALGAPTPYRRWAFPSAYGDSRGLLCDVGAEFSAAYEHFVQALTIRYRQRLLLKSPFNTARLAWPANTYPGARFVHVTREPDAMLRSARHLWFVMGVDQGFEAEQPCQPERERFVAGAFDWMYGRFRHDEAALPPDALLAVRYEDLTMEPEQILMRLFEFLRLDGEDIDRPALDADLSTTDGYKPNRFREDEARASPEPRLLEDYRARYGCEKTA